MPQKIKIKDDDIRALIGPDLLRAKARQDELREERENILLLYSMSKEANGIRELNKEGFSAIVAPLCFEAVEGMKVGLDQLFTSPDFFSVKIADEPDAGERIRKLLRWNIFENQYGGRELRTWLHTTLLNHYGILKVYWDEQYREDAQEFDVLEPEEFQSLVSQGWEPSKFETFVETVETYDDYNNLISQDVILEYRKIKLIKRTPKFIGPKIECIDPETFFYSPDSADLDRCRVVAQRIERRLEDVKLGEMDGRYRKGSYAKVQDQLADSPTEPEGTDVRNEAIGLSSPSTFDTGGEFDRYTEPHRKIVVWEIYTSIDIDNDGLLEPVIIHMAGEGEKGVVLNIVENPYKRPPYRLSRTIEAPFLLEGKPYLQSIEQRQIELTAMRRMLADATATAVYGSVVTNDVEFADNWNARSIGGAILANRVPSDESLKILQPPPPNLSILQTIEMMESEAERISGVTRHSQGITADSLNKTATGMQIINSNTMAKQKYIASVISETYEDVLEDMVACFKLFGEPYIDYYIGKGLEINPEDYQNDFTVEITLGVGPQERMQKAAFLKEALQFAVKVGIPSGFQDIVHAAKMYDTIGELMDVPMAQYHYSATELEERQKQKQQQEAMQAQIMQQQQAMQGAQPQGAMPSDPEQAAIQAGTETLGY